MNRLDKLLLVFITLVMAVLLFRPHEDTFTALDHSGYRWMGKALAEGRGFHETDRVLSQVPKGLRRHLLLLPNMNERNTRDRSFEVLSLNSSRTEPFFYPLLPLLASGMEKIWPNVGLDLVVPLFGVLFFIALCWTGFLFGRRSGMILALVFGLGSPLPLFLFRGFYLESAGTACLIIGTCFWLDPSDRRRFRVIIASFLWGLAVSFHPVFVVLSLPLLLMALLDQNTDSRKLFTYGAAFMLGFLPLILMTQFVCSPYGSLRLGDLLHNASVSSSHRITLLTSFVLFVGFIPLFLTRVWWAGYLRTAFNHPSTRWLSLAFAVLPMGFALWQWEEGPIVAEGVRELWHALRWPLGAVVLVCLCWTVYRPASYKAFNIVLICCVVMPVFCYLKGAEQMGMWSQRRLLPFYALLVLAILPSGAQLSHRIMAKPGRGRPIVRALWMLMAIWAGFSSWKKWPAPYIAKVEAGATHWVDELKSTLGDSWVVFDYPPYSFPFVVDNRTHAVAIAHPEKGGMRKLAEWARETLGEKEWLWVTAYSNPGIEDGVRLAKQDHYSIELNRVHSKSALPAVQVVKNLEVDLLKSIPVDQASKDVELHKVLDGGPLALRGRWGGYRRTISRPDGVRVPADWSVQGSGVVGPVRQIGVSVIVELICSSGREVSQRLEITPPWGGESKEVLVQPGYGVYRAEFVRTLNQPFDAATGIYRFSSPTPYAPSKEGIGGFASDLGVLIHRIRIAPKSKIDF